MKEYAFPTKKDFLLASVLALVLLHQTATSSKPEELPVSTPEPTTVVFSGSRYDPCMVEVHYGYCPIPPSSDNILHTAVRRACKDIGIYNDLKEQTVTRCAVLEAKHQ